MNIKRVISVAALGVLVTAGISTNGVAFSQGNPPPGGPATITEYSVPAGLSSPHGVAKEEGTVASQQGNRNLWFSVLSGDAVVRLDPRTGDETTYVIPGGPHGGITDLRVTPNGRVWFNTGATTFPAGNAKLGMLDPQTNSGTLYMMELGFLDWVIVDQFGNVWSAELGGSSIVMLDPDTGVATQYMTGLAPTGIARRRSGDIWWCERGTGKIGRLDVRNNTITHYSTPFTAIEGCALDPKGDPEGLVWVTPGFAGSPSDGIGSLDPGAGTFTLYTTPTASSSPYGVAIGCAGSVIFGEDFGNNVGVLVPSLATGTVSPSVAVSSVAVSVMFTPAATPFSVTPTMSTATMTTGPSTPVISGGFSQYPTLGTGGEGPHLVLVGPNEKIVYSLITTSSGPGVIGLLELPPAARCRQQ